MLDFTFHVSTDTKPIQAQLAELRSKMAELNEKADRIEAKMDTEAVQGAALKEEVVGLRLKLETLLTDTYAKSEVNQILDRIEAKIPGIVPDEPPVEPPAGE